MPAQFALAISIPACRQQDNQACQQPATDASTIMSSIDSLAGVVQKAHDTKDDKLMASTWAKEGVLIIAGRPPVFGRDAIVLALGNMPPIPHGSKMDIHPLEIQVMNAEWACFRCRFANIYCTRYNKADCRNTYFFRSRPKDF